MDRAMMRAAQRQQIVQLVAAACFAPSEMMHVDERRVPATRYLAAVLIALQHRAAHGGWNRLRGTGH